MLCCTETCEPFHFWAHGCSGGSSQLLFGSATNMNILESLSSDNNDELTVSNAPQSSFSGSYPRPNTHLPLAAGEFAPPTLLKCHLKSCGKVVTSGLKRCGRCKNAWYCNRECQERDWPFHKQNCRDPEKTEEIKEKEAQQQFQQTYEKPLDDTLQTMLVKIGTQMQTMKMVGGTGSRKVKRSVKQDVS